MITGISLENFKGIRERVDIDLKPITLLFGANSAGKSTILHALHYAHELFQRGNSDADLHRSAAVKLTWEASVTSCIIKSKIVL